MTDYFGLIAQPGLRIIPVQLLNLANLNQITFSHLDESQLVHGLTGEMPRAGLRINCQSVLADAHGSIFKHKHGADLERRVRQLTSQVGPLHFSFDTNQDRSDQLHFLISQKRAQYARTGVPDALASAWKTKLLEQLLFTFSDECAGVLSVLKAGDQWLASHFGIKGNGVLQYWLPVYNPELARYAPGKLLLDQICRSTAQHQIHTIDRGEGVTQSKMEVRSEEHQYYRGIWHNNSAPTLIVRGVQSLVWRLRG
jgi:CelD/BcsL family acetyltransferase involved in cellulose biosynthesis